MNVHFSSKTEEWSTPQDFFDELNKEFNFTLDPCATSENAKCTTYFTKKDEGLKKSWGGVHSILQSAIWSSNQKLDQESTR